MFSSCSSQMRLALFVALLAAAPAHASLTDACFNFLEAQDYPRAEAEVRSLMKRNALAREDEWLIQLCLGRTHMATGRLRDAQTTFERIEALSRSAEELAIAYSALGNILDNLKNPDRAEFYALRALRAWKSMNHKEGEAIALNNLAMIVKRRGDMDRALALFRESLALKTNEAEKPTTLNNIALILNSRGEYADAARVFQEAIEIERRQGDSHAAARLQLNLGNTMRQQGNLSGAERELAAGLKAIQMVGDRHWEATACKYLAWLAEDKKSLTTARDWYRRAEKVYREIGLVAEADSVQASLNKLKN